MLAAVLFFCFLRGWPTTSTGLCCVALTFRRFRPRTGISLKKESGAAGDITIVRPAAAAPPRRPEQVELRRARVFGDHPPRDKNTISPAGNIGERARRRPQAGANAFD